MMRAVLGGNVVRRMIIICCILTAGAFYLSSASKSEPVPIRRHLSEFPSRIGEWTEGRSVKFDQATLEVLGVDDYINKLYVGSEGSPIGLYIGYYQNQRAGDTIHSPLNCLPGSGWNPITRDYVKVPVEPLSEDGSGAETLAGDITINRIVVQKGVERNLVLYWYQSHGRIIASEYWGKIYAVIDAIKSNRTDAALVRVICPINGKEKEAEIEAENNAVAFVKSMFPLIGQYLPD